MTKKSPNRDIKSQNDDIQSKKSPNYAKQVKHGI